MIYFTLNDTPYTHTFFYSIINILCSFDPLGYYIPYLSTFGSAYGINSVLLDEELVTSCLHFIDVLLNYHPKNMSINYILLS